MSSLFSAVVEGVLNVVDVAQASIKPFKVTTVKYEDYKKLPVKIEDGHLTLFKRPGSFECVFSNKIKMNQMCKSFSIFRLTNEIDAMTHFHRYSTIINALTHASSSMYDESMLQSISDAIKANTHWRPAHFAAFVGLYECFHHQNIQCDVNYQVEKTRLSPLMAAVMGNRAQCVTVLLELGARLDLQDQHGDTVYHYAVVHFPEVIPTLAKHDNNANSRDRVINYLNNKGWTALSSACQKKKSDIVEALLEIGADPGVTAQELFPIHHALKMGDNKSVEIICKKFKDQLSKRDGKYGGTAMHWARNRQMIEKLCRQTADVNAKSDTGHTPLHIMLEKSRSDCLMELLCWGADPSIGDNEGNTPLHIAVLKDDVEMVKNFVVYGADVNIKNGKNQSPRHLASVSNLKNKDEILYMLHVSGALRCDAQTRNCLPGCFVNGDKNGKPDEHINEILERDQNGLLDEMLSSMCEPLTQTDGPGKDPGYRLLSLDGGGIRGIIHCLILMAIEKEVGKPIKECFDWIAGTSTGGLLALGICTGKPLSYIRGLYLRLKDEVFTGSRPYQSQSFETMLKEEFGEHTVMTDFKSPRAIVTAVLADRHPTKLHLFRTYEPTLQPQEARSSPQREGSTTKNGANSKDRRRSSTAQFYCPASPSEQKVWEAARSSGAAPTYFKAFGSYIDGGLEANNPTLDLMTEIHEYNCGLKLRNEPHLVRPIGVVVSLGTGQEPSRKVDSVDVYMPEGIFDVTKIARGIQNLIKVMVDKATVAEGRPVDRARAWCGMLEVPFYRFSPPISDIELDEHDNKKLIQMMWETQCYIAANRDRIKRVASYLRRDTEQSS